MQGMLKQAQKMQADMAAYQEELETREFESSAGGGMVTVAMYGNKQVKSIKISPDVVDSDDIETLEDLVVAAVNGTLKQIEEITAEEMSKFTGGMPDLGGLLG